MKITRKAWDALQAELRDVHSDRAYLRNIIRSRIRLETADGQPLMDLDLESAALIGKIRQGQSDNQVIHGPVRFVIIAAEGVPELSGYDFYIRSQYMHETVTATSSSPQTAEAGWDGVAWDGETHRGNV